MIEIFVEERLAEFGKLGGSLDCGEDGIGGISRGVHLPGIDRSPDLKLTAVCDIDPEALRYAQETYGIDEHTASRITAT